MVVSRSRTNDPGYGDLTLCGAELEEKKSWRVFRVTFDSKLTFVTHLLEVGSQETGCRGRSRKVI